MSISKFFFLYRVAFRQMAKMVLWAPLLIQALLASLLAVLLAFPFAPVTGPLINAGVDFLRPSLADSFNHYPDQFIYYPYFLGIARMILNLICEAFLLAVVVALLISLHRREQPRLSDAFRQGMEKFLPLAVLWAIPAIFGYLINSQSDSLLAHFLGYPSEQSPMVNSAVAILGRLVTILLYLPIIFMIPALMACRTTDEAIRRGWRTFVGHPLTAFGLVAIPYLIGLGPALLSEQSARISYAFSPEAVVYLSFFGIAADMVANFLFISTATKFCLDRW